MSISNSEDTIDSRDIIARIEELESMQEDAQRDKADAEAEGDLENVDEGKTEDDDNEDAEGTLEEFGFDEDDADELKALKSLQDDAEAYCSDWRYGATLIRESYFPEYAEELAKDIGEIPRNNSDWIVIDWEASAENLKVDYTEVDFDGTTYFVR